MTMRGMTYWLATVSNEDGLYASELIWADGESAESIREYPSSESELHSEAARYNLAIEWFGPFTLGEPVGGSSCYNCRAARNAINRETGPNWQCAECAAWNAPE